MTMIAQFKNHEDNVIVSLYQHADGNARYVRSQLNPDGTDNFDEDVTGPAAEIIMKFTTVVANECLIAGGICPDDVVLSIDKCEAKPGVVL